jgi:hypothetical protein
VMGSINFRDARKRMRSPAWPNSAEQHYKGERNGGTRGEGRMVEAPTIFFKYNELCSAYGAPC